MPIPTPPPDESAPWTAPVVSRDREELPLPPRSAVSAPDAEAVFGRGAFRRLWERPEGYVPLALLGLGLALFLFGVEGTIDKEGLGRNRDPEGFVAAMAFGALFSAVALRRLQIFLTGAARKDRSARSPEDEPWTWDHPWRQEWMAPDYTSSGSMLGSVGFLAFVAVANLVWVSDSWPLRGIVLLFDLLGLIILYDLLKRGSQWLRFRHPVVTWQTLPAFLGDRLEGRVSLARSVLPAGRPRVTLRCVQDEWTTRVGQTSRELQPFAIYKQTRELPLAALGEPLDYVDFGFDLPDGLPGTNLATDRAVYWQIQAIVPAAGPDFESVFLAPVYRRTQEAS